MARLVDVRIDERVRERVRDSFRDLADVPQDQLERLAPMLGVQPRTLAGWIEGRGEPVPRTALGRFVYNGEIPDSWAYRIILGLALEGNINQTGSRGRPATFRDDIGSAPLDVVLDRLLQYLTRDTGDEWIDVQWRSIRLEWGDNDGEFEIEVDYVRDYDSEYGT